MADLLLEKRTLEEALADLRAQYEKHPSRDLARMVQQLEAEIAIRKNPAPKRKSWARLKGALAPPYARLAIREGANPLGSFALSRVARDGSLGKEVSLKVHFGPP